MRGATLRPYSAMAGAPPDRFAIALVIAILVHAAVILGVRFAPSDKPRTNVNTIDVVLVHQFSPKAPKKADFIANANLKGGGNSKTVERPATPLAAPFISDKAEIVASPKPEDSAQPTLTQLSPQEAKQDPEEAEEVTEGEDPATEESRQSRQIAVKSPENDNPRPLEGKKLQAEKRTAAAMASLTNPATDATPAGAAIASTTTALASLSAEIHERLDERAKRPRRGFISARTREHKLAAYMEAWRTKVERIGNLNYPDEARREKLSGDLMLEVAINVDGSINTINIVRPSGHKILDDAAIRIVKHAAPYAPFTKEIRKEYDILHIIRTWMFIAGKRLETR